jgi:hypothetical protein
MKLLIVQMYNEVMRCYNAIINLEIYENGNMVANLHNILV